MKGLSFNRGRSKDDALGVLVLSPVVGYPTPECLKRLDHEYPLREELDPTWTARPIAIARHWERTVLVLEGPWRRATRSAPGKTDRLSRFLRFAVGLASALGKPPPTTCRRCLALRAGAREALSATGAREDRRQSSPRHPVLHRTRQREVSRL